VFIISFPYENKSLVGIKYIDMPFYLAVGSV